MDVEELDRVIDAAENGPLSKADRQKLKTTLHALVERLAQKRHTEKTNSVLEPKSSSSAAAESPEPEPSVPAGQGRNAASAFTGAEKSPYNTHNSNRATLARNAAREEYTGRRSRRR